MDIQATIALFTSNSMNEQYNYMFESSPDELRQLGPVVASTWEKDPKRLLFTFSRYKFVAKMFNGFKHVLEVGCGDAWASRIVKQHVEQLTAIDIDHRFIDSAKYNGSKSWPIKMLTHRLSAKERLGLFDGIYLLDVLEHIPETDENNFLANLANNLNPYGSVIIGIPTLTSQALIPASKRDPGHVNCKDYDAFRDTMRNHFNNVFIFSMNDELVHTGNPNMAHYLIALCCGKKERSSQ